VTDYRLKNGIIISFGKNPKVGDIEVSGEKLLTVGKPGGKSGDPAALYWEVLQKVGFKKALDYLPFEVES
jgi:hypothetical protein